MRSRSPHRLLTPRAAALCSCFCKAGNSGSISSVMRSPSSSLLSLMMRATGRVLGPWALTSSMQPIHPEMASWLPQAPTRAPYLYVDPLFRAVEFLRWRTEMLNPSPLANLLLLSFPFSAGALDLGWQVGLLVALSAGDLRGFYWGELPSPSFRTTMSLPPSSLSLSPFLSLTAQPRKGVVADSYIHGVIDAAPSEPKMRFDGFLRERLSSLSPFSLRQSGTV